MDGWMGGWMTCKAWPRVFYEQILYSLRPPPKTGVLLLLLEKALFDGWMDE